MATNPPCVTIDATVLVALSAREPDKYPIADAEMERYFADGYRL